MTGGRRGWLHPLIFLYGPPGSGKSTVGRILAENLALPFNDLDSHIETQAGMPVGQIFAREGEAGFRTRESQALRESIGKGEGVVALGGGALLDPANREQAERAGAVICLSAADETLLQRLGTQPGQRPLLGPAPAVEAGLSRLLADRAPHYASFAEQFDTSQASPQELAWQVQVRLGVFQVTGMGEGYPARVIPGGLDWLGEMLRERGLDGPLALVSDENVDRLYGERATSSLEGAGYAVQRARIAGGEANKTVRTVTHLWQAFVQGRLERGSTVVALGGGVVGDLAGFAAATYLRGVRWVAVPTSLLAMVDASLGGKTGADLPAGKNLVGAFHAPSLVLADPDLLDTLPEAELRSGLAEVVKHGILADPGLFRMCAQGWGALRASAARPGGWGELVRRGMAVKVRTILADPYERGSRAALNLGHTVGHALEQATGYRLRHGEAVAIGLAAEARLSEHIGLAQPGLAAEIAAALAGLGLPVCHPPEIDPRALLAALNVDKKKYAGVVHFALPVRIGEVRTGVPLEMDEAILMEIGR